MGWTFPDDDSPGRRVLAAALVLAIAGVVVADVWLVISPTRAEQGLSDAAPSQAQLAAAGSYFRAHVWEPALTGEGGTSGCATYAIATKHEGADLVAYTEVLCRQCPPGAASALTPAVFRFVGGDVASVQPVTADGDPEFYHQVKKLFPSSLWAVVHRQTTPHVERLKLVAGRQGGC